MTRAFSYPRRVAFGDCDPARIYYTPRAFDYCVEAIEAWWESTHAISWNDLLARRGLEVRFFRAESEFLRPLVAGQVVRVGIRVPGNGPSRLLFRVSGEGESGDLCFRATLTAGLVDRKREVRVPIPREDRERIARYEAACGNGEQEPEGSPVRETAGGRGDRSTASGEGQDSAEERSRFPEGMFTRTRRVVFGDCSAAGTVYFPNLLGYAVEAVGEWFEEIPGVSWMELVSVRNQGAPAVAASCELHRPMTAGQVVAMGVRVVRLGRASLDLSIEGTDPDGLPLFTSRTTLCFIDQEGGFRSMPIPEEFRRRIERYRDVIGNGGGKEIRPGTAG